MSAVLIGYKHQGPIHINHISGMKFKKCNLNANKMQALHIPSSRKKTVAFRSRNGSTDSKEQQ